MRAAAVHMRMRTVYGGAARRGRALTLAPILMAGLLGFGLCVDPPFAAAQVTAKVIQGKVLDGGTAPLPGGIVYLQDQKTNVIKTFIATDDGSYRFGQLPSDTDYKIWAEFKGQKSKEKLISSFDTKMNVTLNFHVGEK